MSSRTAVKVLLTFVLGLPILMAVFGWVGGLLSAMGDTAASEVLGYINTATSILWLLSIVGLVIAMAFDSFDEPRED